MKRRSLSYLKTPWLWLPFLALIPLTAAVISHHQPPVSVSASPQASPTQPKPTIAASPFPEIRVTSSPKPVSKLSQQPNSQPTSKNQQPNSQLKPNSQPTLTADQQAALNRKAKAEFQSSAASADSAIEMHVALAEGVPVLKLGTSSQAVLLDQNGHPLQSLAAGAAYTVQAQGSAISINSLQLSNIAWIEPAADSVLFVGDRSYHGRLLLIAKDGYIWAVNYVNMRQYLYSVVGSEESPSWPIEALKAQAVAARSYALVHYFRPASSFYHLGSTETYQVYGGIEREADATRQAVDSTAGEFVSYRGGIVESLYAASEDIVTSVFEGKGMSQLGSLDLAKKGYGYHQILSTYYPTTGVSRIEVDQD